MLKNLTSERHALYKDMETMHLTPLWETLHTLVPKHPSPGYDAAL